MQIEKQPKSSHLALSVGRAVLLGHLLVTLPAAVLIAGFGIAGAVFAREMWWAVLLVGFVLAWAW